MMFPFDSLLHILGLAASLLIGVTLGLIGSGGAAITVPVFVYLMGYTASQSIAYSLFVVGITSLVGGLISLKRGQVKWSPLIWFGIPSVVMVLITRRVILPLIPEIIFQHENYTLDRETLLLVFFAVMLVYVAYRMIYSPPLQSHFEKGKAMYTSILVGIAVGFLTGLVGVGGGFIIVPVLILYFGLDAKQAVGTSLWLIAMNSLFGFSSQISLGAGSWNFLFGYTLLTVTGIFIGLWMAKYISSQKLKPIFGYVILLLGVFIIIEQLFFPIKK